MQLLVSDRVIERNRRVCEENADWGVSSSAKEAPGITKSMRIPFEVSNGGFPKDRFASGVVGALSMEVAHDTLTL